MHQSLSGFRKIFVYTLAIVVIGTVTFAARTASAAAYKKWRAPEVQLGPNGGQRITLFDGKFKGGATVAAADIDGDGIDEYIVGAGAGGGPHVEVFAGDGSLRTSFFAFDAKNRDGINVAAGDLDGDGRAEIVVTRQPGSKPEVRVFSGQGSLIRSFNVFEGNFAGGVTVGVIPATANNVGSIIVGSGFGREAEVRVYDQTGSTLLASFNPLGKATSNGTTVAGSWSDTFGEPVVVIGAGPGIRTLVQVFGVTSKQKLAQWLAYDERVKTGVSVAVRSDVVVTSPLVGGGPDVRMFTIRRHLLSSALVFEPKFRGGLQVAATVIGGQVTFAVTPMAEAMTANGSGKKIVISLSKQTMNLFERGRLVSVRRVSTGKWSTPTPTGSFAVKNKIPVAYSRAYGLYMENWMAFSADGRYGLHSLPFWKLRSGGRLYEGAAHIGTPVSHGCVRQTLAESKTLFDWAVVGTPVVIQS